MPLVAAFEGEFLWLTVLTLGIVTSDEVIVESFAFAARSVTVTLAGTALSSPIEPKTPLAWTPSLHVPRSLSP
ncbi:hypothetical protein [Streptomyces sp. NPDC005525]|uniref:hypothetical protein n=1 Tax=Streptomyces sp. NPDC005525 TaxID=3364720 RepID=UPI003680D3C8